ncbi:antitoxin of ParD toxin-antitoxin type II system and RHH [Nitrosomonas ureae]|uniref:Antitoxin of ParD toxin-antitoxin type II system and RHH n=2 Tax=Nitrosomonas ureae TaxID=44577 RepID=A0A286A3N0_9PROT|nr:antitoxin of ParD toxin-antitoxin type II system and RHH [Nitrosomonas ureae]
MINSANEMKHEAPGTQQLRHINKIGEGASIVQRSDSLVQPINLRLREERQTRLETLHHALIEGEQSGTFEYSLQSILNELENQD